MPRELDDDLPQYLPVEITKKEFGGIDPKWDRIRYKTINESPSKKVVRAISCKLKAKVIHDTNVDIVDMQVYV
jgi:hypothetical protein